MAKNYVSPERLTAAKLLDDERKAKRELREVETKARLAETIRRNYEKKKNL